jgi:hypothetical protein
MKATPANSWICWPGITVAKPKSKPSSGWKAGDPGEHLAGSIPARVTLGAQDLFQKVGEGGRLAAALRGNAGGEIGNSTEPLSALNLVWPAARALCGRHKASGPAATAVFR